jgi:hypothetical protein
MRAIARAIPRVLAESVSTSQIEAALGVETRKSPGAEETKSHEYGASGKPESSGYRPAELGLVRARNKERYHGNRERLSLDGEKKRLPDSRTGAQPSRFSIYDQSAIFRRAYRLSANRSAVHRLGC